jgi:predicted amidohydrolase
VETFAELADRHDVYLEAGVNMAREWRIVCRDLAAYKPPPGAGPCDEENAGKVDQLRDPDEPQRDYAYEAATDQPSNMALVFDPDGKLISKQVKTYLTPVELPGQLDLVPGDVSSGLSALDTPVGRLGFVTSKDAWMPT